MKYPLWGLLCICCMQGSQAQCSLDAGNDDGITITSCSKFQSDSWSDTASASNVIDGSELDHERFMMARFLEQNIIGFEQHDIDDIVEAPCEERQLFFNSLSKITKLLGTMLKPKVMR